MLGRMVAIPAPPLVSRLALLYLYVRDMPRSVAFYREVLGLPIAGDDHWAEAELPGGVRFALHAMHEGVAPPSSGTIHVDFEVEDVDAAADAIRAAGIEVRETMRDEWGAAVEIVDPDGYRIYLFEPRT
jgi:glyoxylase I family protein